MATRWIGLTLFAGCLLQASAVMAQCSLPCADANPRCACPNPNPNCGGPCGPLNMVPGPMSPQQAPPGPPCDLSLPADTPGAFSGEEPCPHPYVWADVEALGWKLKDPRFPAPLITSSVLGANGVPLTNGTLGLPGTVILLDDRGLKDNPYGGSRINAGFWFDSSHTVCLEGSGFLLEKKGASFEAQSGANGAPVVSIPFFDAVANAENVLPLTNLNGAIGGAAVTTSSRLWGAEANLALHTPCQCFNLVLLGGVRYLDLEEDMDIYGSRTPLPALTPTTVTADHFGTRNQFVGPQVGARLVCSCCKFFVAGQAEIAAGSNHEEITTYGSVTTTPPGTSVPFGLFTHRSNIVFGTKDVFAAVPEGQVRVGCMFSPCLSAYVGYTWLYLTRAVHPWEQLDRDTTLPPGTPGTIRPFAPFAETSFWAQGISLGIELSY